MPTAGPLAEGLVLIAIIVIANPNKTPTQPEIFSAQELRTVGILVISAPFHRDVHSLRPQSTMASAESGGGL